MPVVYFVRGRTSGLIKIGRATNFGARLSAIRSQSPEPIDALGVIESDDSKGLEAEIHLRFAPLRERGEWFRDDTAIHQFMADHTVLSGYEPPAYSVSSMPWARASRPMR
jgi:hypothetical protein